MCDFVCCSLMNLERIITQDLKVQDGLGAFFTYIDKDECLAAEPLVSMATTYSNVKVN